MMDKAERTRLRKKVWIWDTADMGGDVILSLLDALEAAEAERDAMREQARALRDAAEQVRRELVAAGNASATVAWAQQFFIPAERLRAAIAAGRLALDPGPMPVPQCP